MNIFSKIVNKRVEDAHFAFLGTDLHSHVLPGIDDGAEDMEASVGMIQMFKKLGYSKLITTPHIMSDRYKNTPKIILDALENLKKELKKRAIDIEIEAAAEYFLDAEFIKKVKNKSLLTFKDNFVLFELPHFTEPSYLDDVIFEMQLAGYQPVLAHPERYIYWHDKFHKYEEIADKKILFQVNLLSLTGHYDNGVRKIAEKLIENGMVSFLGSDCHRVEQLYILKSKIPENTYNRIKRLDILNKQL